MESCNLSKNVKIISTYVDRQNIRLPKHKNFSALNLITSMLFESKEKAPRCLIYCRSVSLVG
jgi:hypothetical protein